MRETIGSTEVILCDFCKNADVKTRLTGSKLPYVRKGWAIKDGKDICPLCIDKLNNEKEENRKRIAAEIDSINRNFDFNNPLFKAALKPIMNYYLIAVMVEITNVRAKIITIYKKSAAMLTRSEINAITTKKIGRGELKKITILSITKLTEEEFVKIVSK